MTRRQEVDSIAGKSFDVIIIGGGITGSGILLELASRGYSCLLVEKGDFASGTSSKSAKLIHGGIRYLKYGKIGLIKESLDERNYLLKTYPHLVKPLPFLFPVYDSTFKYRVGMAIYHFLSSEELLPDYRYLEKDEVVHMHPGINAEGLQGGFIYYDAVTNDARLCVEVILEARRFSHAAALNYCEVISSEPLHRMQVVKCRDHIDDSVIEFKGNYIANASGVWTDEVLMRIAARKTNYSAPSKGVHLVVSQSRFPLDTAVIIPSYVQDNRLNYAIPWEHNSVIIGTTDTDYSDDLNHPGAQDSDIEYLLHSINMFMPSLHIKREDVLYIYSGLRPMYNDSAPSYQRSRDYRIWWEGDKMLNILGGKLTSYHSMAEAMADELLRKLSPARKVTLPMRDIAKASYEDLPKDFTDSIRERFLERAPDLFNIARENNHNSQYIHAGFKISRAEVIYYIRETQCYHLDDLLSRRLSLSYVINGCSDRKHLIESLAQVMGAELGWSESSIQTEIEEYSKLFILQSAHSRRDDRPSTVSNSKGASKCS